MRPRSVKWCPTLSARELHPAGAAGDQAVSEGQQGRAVSLVTTSRPSDSLYLRG